MRPGCFSRSDRLREPSDGCEVPQWVTVGPSLGDRVVRLVFSCDNRGMLDVSAVKATARPAPNQRRRRSETLAAEFSILVVCRGNICRSPMAEFLLRHSINDRGLPVQVSSAGTHAKPHTEMDPLARQTLASMGIEAGKFFSRPLSAPVVERADLILTMTDAQRSWVVQVFPEAVRRTYLLSQFSRLVEAVDASEPIRPDNWGASLLSRAVEGRTLVQPLVDGRNIDDPVGRPLRQFQACARTIEQRIEPLFAGISPRTGK